MAFALVIAAAPAPLRAQLHGNTAGSTVSGFGIDDVNTSTTIKATYLDPATSPILDPVAGTTILNQLAGFPGTYVFAGTGHAINIPAVPSSDFNLVEYHPWVVNNNPIQNEIIGPDGANWNRGIYNQDAGGADFLLQYTPHLPTDPTQINFIQGFSYNQTIAGQNFRGAKLDNRGGSTPNYNGNFRSTFVNNTNDRSSPLVIPAGGSAFLLDIPYRCENGGGANCANGNSNEEYLTFHTQIFQTWVEAATPIPGHGVENVLYGGVRWGYTYSNADTPGLYIVGSTDFVTEGQTGVSTLTVTNIGLSPGAITTMALSQSPTIGDSSDYASIVGPPGGTCQIGLILAAGFSCTVDVPFTTDLLDRGPLYDGITPFLLSVTLDNGAAAIGAQLVVVSDAAPEPGGLGFLASALGALAVLRRRRVL
jgi:MYXO-CTERM domain-containing protein